MCIRDRGVTLTFDAPSLRRMSLVYGEMIDYAAEIYFELFAPGKYDADFEISIDETTTPTSPLEHFFVANELRVRGVRFALSLIHISLKRGLCGSVSAVFISVSI